MFSNSRMSVSKDSALPGLAIEIPSKSVIECAAFSKMHEVIIIITHWSAYHYVGCHKLNRQVLKILQ